MADSSIVGLHGSSIALTWIRDEDDWSGISELRERRKIQNRRNQRAHRKRQRELGNHENGASGDTEPPPAGAVATRSLVPSQQTPTGDGIEGIVAAIRTINIHDPQSERNRTIVKAFEELAHRHYLARNPDVKLLPSLSQFNIIKAFLVNTEILGLSADQMTEESNSPFNQPAETSATLVSRLPAGLRPTDLQRATLHHPWLDLLPVPEMRDNLFRRGLDFFDEDKLCHALCGRHEDPNPGILVWREPWDPNGWEVTESFLRSWGWVLEGCLDLRRSTNRWRARRGERPLFRLPS